jgi:hypothetical protein
MLEYCPKEEEKSKLFVCHFLQRLPTELRLPLPHQELTDLKDLAAEADKLNTATVTSSPLPPMPRRRA